MSERQWNVLSLGAGVQSSTLALMAAHGEVTPMPDFAVFADTQDEPASVYRWLDWLEKQLPFPVHRVTKGKLSDAVLTMRESKKGELYSRASVPFHVVDEHGKQSIVTHRNCTSDYKIKPIQKFIRQACGIKRGQKEKTVTSWIGISYDEMQRMKANRDRWCLNRFPLVELRMERRQCFEWMRKNGYPEPPKSACVYCPFKSAEAFRKLQLEEPEEFAKAVQFERDVNAKRRQSPTCVNTVYVYRSCKPLDTIDFRNDIERGQMVFPDFIDECEGMCGV